MAPLNWLKKILVIDDTEEVEVVEEIESELKTVKPEVKAVEETEVVKETKEEPKAEKEEVLPEKTKKLSEMVPSAESKELKKPKRKVHIDVSDKMKNKSDKQKVKTKNKFESTPIISPIYGMTEKNDSRVILATKPAIEEKTHKNNNKTKDSVLDTIISPIFGTDIGNELGKSTVNTKTVVYNEISENQYTVKNDYENEKLSLDDILQTPAKKIVKNSELSQNMTIFDDDIEED